MTADAQLGAQPAGAPSTVGLTPGPLVAAVWFFLFGAVGLLVIAAAPALLRGLGVTEVSLVAPEVPAPHPLAPKGGEPAFGREGHGFEVGPGAANDDVELVMAPRALSLRSEPSAKAKVVLEAKKGSQLLVMREQDGWVLVMAPSKNKADPPNLGWVSLADLLRP